MLNHRSRGNSFWPVFGGDYMPKVYVSVDGVKEIIQDLKSMGDKGKAVLQEAAQKGAEHLQPKIQAAIPVSDADSKHLRDNIRIKKARGRRSAVQSADIIIGTNRKKYDYGFHFETGTYGKEGSKVIRRTTDKHAAEVANKMVEHFLDRLGV